MSIPRIWVLVYLAASVVPTAATGADYIWIEGEHARQQTVHRHNWYDSVNRSSLSGGDWISHYASAAPGQASYSFRVARQGDYDFWVRCNPIARAQLAYALDGQKPQDIDMSQPIDSINIAADGKPDMRFVAWIHVGAVPLTGGAHTIRFLFHGPNNNHGAIDCFVFSLRPFRPRGVLKPGARSGLANPGFFAWEPDTDSFGDDALVDLRHLNESTAGEAGRVRAEGSYFVLGNGHKVRFWAANAGPSIWKLDHDSHRYLARRLAKLGVNMVRLHGPLYDAHDPTVHRDRLDSLQHFVYALKQEGIYTELSFFFPLWYHLDDDKPSFMLVFFDPELQKSYYSWASALLTTPSPYTKIPLGKDPAVAIVELLNEDSHFFWTFGKKNMPVRRWQLLKKLYGTWLTKKYGSLDRARLAWGDVQQPGDRPESGAMELYDVWEMTQAGLTAHPRLRARVSDQVQFLTENMRGFYAKTIDYLRTRCGYDGMVSCGNWHVADPAILDALERYCYTAGDVIDHHGYFDQGHQGQAARYSVRPGQQFTSQSALALQHANPLPFVETDGFPHIVSEIGWPAPNMYRAEFTFLTSAYGSLQGLDGVFSFALGSAGWDQQMKKFALSDPVGLGCFPAAALIYRSGYLREGPAIVEDHLDLKDLYALKGTPVYASAAMDQLRAADVPAGKKSRAAIRPIDPLAFYVGRVVRSFDGQKTRSSQQDLTSWIDRRRGRIKSATGQQVWDYARGMAAVNAPQAQGVAGFVGRIGPIALSDVVIDMKNDYGTVTVVPLDGVPIKQSKRILIQCMTIEQFHGFKATGKNNLSGHIENTGSAPVGVERFDVRVTLKLDDTQPVRVIACDEHGYARKTNVRTSGTPGTVTIQLDPTSPYHVVERK